MNIDRRILNIIRNQVRNDHMQNFTYYYNPTLNSPDVDIMLFRYITHKIQYSVESYFLLNIKPNIKHKIFNC